MARRRYRGVIVFNDGSKLCLHYTKDKCMAQKKMKEQLDFSRIHGNKHYRKHDKSINTEEVTNNPCKVIETYFEVWEYVKNVMETVYNE